MKCNIRYKGSLYNEEDAAKVVSYHYLVEDNLINSSEGSISKKINRLEVDPDRELVAKETINKINNQYGLGTEVVTLQEDLGIVDINVNPISESIIGNENSGENDFGLNETTQYQRYSTGLGNLDEETLDNFNRKANLMEEVFSRVGIASHIIFDGDMVESGALLGTNSTEYKDLLNLGNINNGDAVIKVNPNKLYSDTLLHEYGHIFIDLMGGMKHPRMKYTYAKVRNTDTARQIREQYSDLELTEDDLAREVLATFIGREASELVDVGEENRNYIQSFIDWIIDGIRSLLGLPTGDVRSLAKEMLNGDIDVNSTLSSTTQFFRNTKEARNNRSANLKNIDAAQKSVDKINSRISQALSSIGKSEDPSKKEFRSILNGLQNEMKMLSDKSNLVSIGTFIENMTVLSDNILEVLHENNDKVNNGEDIQLSFNLLNEIENLNSLLAVLHDLDTNITSGAFKREFAKENWSDEEAKVFINNINDLKIKHNEIQDLHIRVGRHHIANKLGKYSNRVIVTRRLELEREYKQLYPIKPGETHKQYEARRRDYVNTKITEELPELKQQEKEWILDRLQSSPADIGGFAAWVSSEKDLNSMPIQMASKLLDEADLKKDQQMLEFKMKAFAEFEEFNKSNTATDPRKKYEGLYQEGSDDTLYLTTEYDVEWYITRTKLERAYLDAADKYNREGEIYHKAFKEYSNWMRENTINVSNTMTAKYIPTPKWKNKTYEKIMSDPKSPKARMLKFLIEASKSNHKMLHGNNSLVKTTSQSNVEFIQVPSIGRSTFEKAVSGNLLANIKDSFERLYKAKTDDTDLVGQVDNLEGEKESLRMLQDSKGNLRYGVPIYFRGKMPLKEVSYDLLSSITIDSYMSMNYLHKSSLQVELELMKDIVANKDIDQTMGFLKKTIYNARDRANNTKVDPIKGIKSNEYKVLNSIIENRLYGIKNINIEYAKLASTLMSWSASSMLMFNIPSAMVNVMQGKVFNFLEASSGEFFNMKDLKKAEGDFFKDMKGWVNDIGRPVHTAKTNQLLELLNIQGEFKALSSKFIEDNRVKALATSSTAYGLSHMGEIYMHGTLMYAILNNIKIMNSQNQFIDKDGKVTTKDKAMTLSEAFSVDPKTNNLVLNKHVYKTNFGNSTFSLNTKDKGLLEVKALINKIAHDLHGNYNDEIQNMAQRTIVGKMMFMLRKWMVPGFNRRWRGAVHFRTPTDKLQDEVDNFYSEDLQAFQEGYYTTALRFLNNTLSDLKQLQFQTFSKNWDELSDREKANMRRFITEASMIILTFASSMILYGLAQGVDDPVEREVLFHLTYYTRRMFSEFTFYSNPIEAFKIMSTPAASLSYVAKLGKFGDQLTTDLMGIATGEGLEVYERGNYAGELKLWKRTVDLVPILNQYHRDIEESTGWLFNAR